MSAPIALMPPPPCEPVHMRCAPMRRTRAPGANRLPTGQFGGRASLPIFPAITATRKDLDSEPIMHSSGTKLMVLTAVLVAQFSAA